MELKVGMYVRTKKGIERIKLIEENFMERNNTFIATDNDEWRGAYNGKFNGFTIRNNVITKASHNIIDLIEVGDYVNGHKVLEVNQFSVEVESNAIENETWEEIENYEIKSIVTKEQFSSMEYKVNE